MSTSMKQDTTDAFHPFLSPSILSEDSVVVVDALNQPLLVSAEVLPLSHAHIVMTLRDITYMSYILLKTFLSLWKSFFY